MEPGIVVLRGYGYTMTNGVVVVAREFAPGLLEVVVLDMGGLEVTLSATRAQTWNEEPSALLKIARAYVVAAIEEHLSTTGALVGTRSMDASPVSSRRRR